jgi:mono/diheme cytochrome c family protein
MKPVLKWLGLALLALAAVGFWLSRPQRVEPLTLPAHQADPVNGERLFHAGGCASCHGERLDGGLRLQTAFGTFRAPNITPDPAAGIGGWSDTDFIDAMKSGLSPAGRHYYPAFPYTSYTRMSVEDLLDLKSWLDTYAPVGTHVADHELAFPWNIRRGIGLWKRLYLDASPVLAADDGGDRLRRGRYLVEAVGHCGECHTPRNRLGGLQKRFWLAGGPNPDGEGRVPNITPHSDGLADWSERDIVRYLKSGFTPEFDTVGGSMAEVQENLARLPDSDREAIAAYLLAVPPVPDTDAAD